MILWHPAVIFIRIWEFLRSIFRSYLLSLVASFSFPLLRCAWSSCSVSSPLFVRFVVIVRVPVAISRALFERCGPFVCRNSLVRVRWLRSYIVPSRAEDDTRLRALLRSIFCVSFGLRCAVYLLSTLLVKYSEQDGSRRLTWNVENGR